MLTVILFTVILPSPDYIERGLKILSSSERKGLYLKVDSTPVLLGKHPLAIQIDSLGEGIELDKGMLVGVEFSEGGVTAHYANLDLHTLPLPTFREAIEEVKAQTLDLYDHLMSRDDTKLGPKPTRWKKHLSSLISVRK